MKRKVSLYEYENIDNAAEILEQIGSHDFNPENTVETRAGEVLEGMRHVPLTSYWARSALKQPGAAAAAPKRVHLNMSNTRAQIQQLKNYRKELTTIIQNFEAANGPDVVEPLLQIKDNALHTFKQRYGIRGDINTRDDIIPIIHTINSQARALLEEGYVRGPNTRAMPHYFFNATTRHWHYRDMNITIDKIYMLYWDIRAAFAYYNNRV